MALAEEAWHAVAGKQKRERRIMKTWAEIKGWPVVDGWHKNGNYMVKIEQGAVIGSGAEIGAYAKIEPYAVIEQDAKIGAYAEIGHGAMIEQDAEIGAYAVIGSGAEIEPGAKIEPYAKIGQGAKIKRGLICIQGSRHLVNLYHPADRKIMICCEIHTWEEWAEKGQAIYEQYRYTPEQIVEYRRYLQLFADTYGWR